MLRPFLSLVLLLLLCSCSSLTDVRLHYDTQPNITARFGKPGEALPGYAKWQNGISGRECDIYIIPPDEFAWRHYRGYTAHDGTRIETWDDLYQHELRHCREGK